MYYLTTNNVWKISNFLRVKRFVLKNTLPPLDFGIPHVSSKSATKIRHLFIGLLVCTLVQANLDLRNCTFLHQQIVWFKKYLYTESKNSQSEEKCLNLQVNLQLEIFLQSVKKNMVIKDVLTHKRISQKVAGYSTRTSRYSG